MRVPDSLEPLVEQGVIDDVIRPLMSGKEAQVYLVEAQGHYRVAKVYKNADHRSFKHRADYTEGRKVRNTRSQRAMSKRSKFGKEQVEEAWRNAEVDVIYRLFAAGVRVPEPYDFCDGVLVMELIGDPSGEPAPRLVDVRFTEAEARALFNHLLGEVQRMLCVGVVHGDLSDFNVLITPDGPVIIDFPQAVDPAHNNNARKLLIRDVSNLTQFLARYVPDLKTMRYGEEMWELYERGELTPTTKLTGRTKRKDTKVDTRSLLDEIADIEREARARREALGLPPPRRARTPVIAEGPAPKPLAPQGSGGGGKKRRGKSRGGQGGGRPEARPQEPARPAKAAAPAPPSLDDLDDFLIIE